jgi:hypothetical protein
LENRTTDANILGKMLDSRPFLKEPSNIHDGSRYQL